MAGFSHFAVTVASLVLISACSNSSTETDIKVSGVHSNAKENKQSVATTIEGTSIINPFSSSSNQETEAKNSPVLTSEEQPLVSPKVTGSQELTNSGPNAELQSSDNFSESKIVTDQFEISGSSGYLSWRPIFGTDSEIAINHPVESRTLVINSNTGKELRLSAGVNEILSLNQPLTDGSYKWEIVNTPYIDPEVRSKMMAVRESGNLDEHKRMARQYRKDGYLPSAEQLAANQISGQFTVRDGVLLSSEAGDES